MEGDLYANTVMFMPAADSGLYAHGTDKSTRGANHNQFECEN